MILCQRAIVIWKHTDSPNKKEEYFGGHPYTMRAPLSLPTPPLWTRENGTICPFAFFSPVLPSFLANLTPIPVTRPSVILLDFPFLWASWLFWGFGSQIHHLSFSTPQMTLSTLPKHYVLLLDRWFHFHARTPPPTRL